ncbi:RNA polymerase sigma factor [Streptomyces sp. NPDC002187]|uniref:RNA polymerase sigma factor n=1 Tax=Streptomyces sp. NPDC002187 TaxID=3364637 RepID=UPI00369E7050
MGTYRSDEDARRRLEELYAAHAGQVHAFAARRVGPASAPDMVSETFLVAWRRIDEIRDPALPWLLATARRLVANELRGQARRSALTERLGSLAPGMYGTDPSALAQQEVITALRTLPDADQEVLTLAVWHDLSGPQAARVLGCSPGTYAVRLHRARRRLRRRMESAHKEAQP